MPIAYLDTCIVSGIVKGDLPAIETAAVTELMAMQRCGAVRLVCSDTVRSEIARIPKEYRCPHQEVLEQFAELPVARVGAATRLGLSGGPTTNPRRKLWKRIERTLKDEGDQWHVFVAACNRVEFLITADQRTMLSRKASVLAETGVQLVVPSEFLAHVLEDAS